MAYSPTTWVNDMPPPLSAVNLNKLTNELEQQAAARGISHSLPNWVDGAEPALSDPEPLNELERVTEAVASSLGLSYTPTVWGVGWTPSRNAARFNKLEQQVALNSVTPPPPVGESLRGVGWMMWANGDPPYTHGTDYDLVMTSWGGTTKAGNLGNRRTLVYMSAISCIPAASGWHYGMTAEQARAAGAVLHDVNGGAELTNASYSGILGNLGVTAYRQQWAANVANKLAGWPGIDGVFIDDFNRSYSLLAGSKIAAEYPGSTSAPIPAWEAAQVGWLSYVASYLHARGYYVAVNAGAWIGGFADSDTGKSDLDWWTQIYPYADALMSEGWVWSLSIKDYGVRPGNGCRRSGPEWYNNWDGWMRLPALLAANGKDFLSTCYADTRVSTTPSATVQADYVLASMLLETQANKGTLFFCPGGAENGMPEPWHSTFDNLPMGNPLGAKTQNGNRWERQFQNGMVWVDPTNGTSGIT